LPPYQLPYHRLAAGGSALIASGTLEIARSSRSWVYLRVHRSAVQVTSVQAIRAGLVDEYQLFVGPAIVGGGNPFFPDDVRVDLELLDERRFGNGVVYLRYGVKDHGQRG
jgi:hypothetical protein